MRPRLLASVLAAVSLLAAAPTVATATPIDDVNIGPVVTIAGPDTYRPGEPLTISGHLRFQVGLPIVFETAQPVPNQSITVMLDEEPLRTVTSNADGSWRTELTFDASPPFAHELRAVAFEGTPLQVSSRTIFVRRDLVYTELRIDPPTATIVPNAGIQLTAIALDGEGREHDVTELADWTSAAPTIVSVSNAEGTRGIATGLTRGSATITATFETLSATAQIDVT